jgi:hypothetical protein
MSAHTVDGELSLRQSVIKQQCLMLRLPTLASQCGPLAEQAERERQPYLGYLEALLAAELEERERRAIDRRIKDAHLPRVKTLDEFDFRQAQMVSPTRMSELAEGGYIDRAEPIVFIGDSGTARPICSRRCAWRPAASDGGYGSRPRPPWSMSWSKPSSNSSCAAPWAAGRAMT